MASGSFPRVFWRLKWMPQASFLGPNRCPTRSDRIQEYAKRFGYDPTVLRALHPPSALPVPLEYGTSVSTLHGSRKNKHYLVGCCPTACSFTDRRNGQDRNLSHPPPQVWPQPSSPPTAGGGTCCSCRRKRLLLCKSQKLCVNSIPTNP